MWSSPLTIMQVVCEESPEPYRYGTARTKQKKRYIGGIVTPAQPTYLHGLVDEKGDAARLMEAAPPVLGVAASVSGYKVRLMPNTLPHVFLSSLSSI